MICVFYHMMGAPEGSLKVVLLRSRNRTWDPWLTRHKLIPYTTVASQKTTLYTPLPTYLIMCKVYTDIGGIN